MLPSPPNIYFFPESSPSAASPRALLFPFFYQFPTVAGMELLIPLLPLFFCSLFAALFSSCFFIPLKPGTWNNLHLCKRLEGEQFVGHRHLRGANEPENRAEMGLGGTGTARNSAWAQPPTSTSPAAPTWEDAAGESDAPLGFFALFLNGLIIYSFSLWSDRSSSALP